MNGQVKHITDLTREDLRQIAAACDPEPGLMIRIEKTPKGLKIGIDENAIKIGVFAFLRNLGAIPAISPSVETICNTSMNLS